MRFSVCHVPDKPGVNRTEQQLTTRSFFSCLWNVVEHPLYFCSREIRVDNQTGLFTHIRTKPHRNHFFANGGRALILPHDGVIYRLTSSFIPHHGGFTLIGNAYSHDCFRMKLMICNQTFQYTQLRVENLYGIMLHPTRLWKDLPKFFLCNSLYLT